MNKIISGPTHHVFKASGQVRISEPGAFLDWVASYCDTCDLPVSTTSGGRLKITTDTGSIRMRPSGDGLSIRLIAQNEGALFMLKETVAYQVETAGPNARIALDWDGEAMQGHLPPNFREAQIVSVAPLGRSFWRLVLDGDDLAPFARDGLHLRLALPRRSAPPRWPRLDDRGRAVWPSPDDLHVAVYTVRDVDPATGRLTIDIFRHAGGRTSDWMEAATVGDPIGLIGPGGGWFPGTDHLVLAGDETALPAMSRILENTGDHVTGTAIVEVAGGFDYPPLAVPPGMTLSTLDRRTGNTLEEALTTVDLGQAGARYIWFAAEKARASAIRAELRGRRGVDRTESYVTGYWHKT